MLRQQRQNPSRSVESSYSGVAPRQGVQFNGGELEDAGQCFSKAW